MKKIPNWESGTLFLILYNFSGPQVPECKKNIELFWVPLNSKTVSYCSRAFLKQWLRLYLHWAIGEEWRHYMIKENIIYKIFSKENVHCYLPRTISTHRAVNILNFLSELFPVQLNRYLLRFSFVESINLTSVNTNIPWHCGVVPCGFFSQVRTGFPPSLATPVDLFGEREGSIVGNLNFLNSSHWVKTFTFIKSSLPVNA